MSEKTKNLKFQLGVSKIFNISTDELWTFILSKKGILIWLGEINCGEFEVNKLVKTKNDIEVKLTVFTPNSHLRFSWKNSDWENSSIVELRIKKVKERSQILFHQTNLSSIEQRTQMKNYWSKKLNSIKDSYDDD